MEINLEYLKNTKKVIGMACLMRYHLVRPRETKRETVMGAPRVQWMVSQMVLLNNVGLVFQNLAVWVCPRAIRMGYLMALSMVTRKVIQMDHLMAKLLVLPKDCLIVPMMEHLRDQEMGLRMVHLMEYW
jgi:hypothetical protein